ncbi:MAG: master DNA invertase Mpi family serine-type recombinase [Kiritimatiellia bacterium]
MVYGYIRVSTDKQTVENQRFEINRFCLAQGIQVDRWIKETISGTKPITQRALGPLLRQTRVDDLLICTELSRLGRTLFMILDILNICMNRGVRVWTIKDNYRLGDDISSKVLAFAFGISAEIERNLISQRTKEALARRRAEGLHLGAPAGVKRRHKLTPYGARIQQMLLRGLPRTRIAKRLHVHRTTLLRFLREQELHPSE